MKVLGGLVEAIEQIKKTIANHRDLLTGSEALTRYALIDPLLRVLEWDTADPAQVRPELVDAQRISDRRPRIDYVLMHDDRNIAVIEAKKLQEALEGHVGQAVDYGSRRGTRYTIITDGSEWRFYNTFEPIPLEDRTPITDFNITNGDVHSLALKALHLWRPNLSAQSITVPPERVAQPAAQEAGEAAATPSTRAARRRRPRGTVPTALPNDSGDWQPLNVVASSPLSGKLRPTHVRLPNTQDAPAVTWWKDVLHETAKWLVQQGKLGSHNLPMGYGRSRYVASMQRVHPSDKGFFLPRDASGGVSVETHGDPHTLMKSTLFMLKECDVDPATVYLRFDG